MSCIDQAKDAVNGDRRKDYGDAVESFGRIAGLWTAYLGVHVTPKDVGNMMILLKTSRSKRQVSSTTKTILRVIHSVSSN